MLVASSISKYVDVLPFRIISEKPYLYSNFYSGVKNEKLLGVMYPGRGKNSDGCGTYEKMYSCKCQKKIKIIRHHCNRLTCPICYQNGMMLTANRISERFKEIRKMFKTAGFRPKFNHWTINTMWKVNAANLSYYKQKLYKIMKKEGVSGILIWHPWRRKGNQMRYSSHFHIIGIGNLGRSSVFYTRYGFTYKFIRQVKTLRSMRRLVYYLLSHSGVVAGKHTISWFNQLAYNKLSKEIDESSWEYPECESCESYLIKVKTVPVKVEGGLFTPMRVFMPLGKWEFESGVAFRKKIVKFSLNYKGDIVKFAKGLYVG